MKRPGNSHVGFMAYSGAKSQKFLERLSYSFLMFVSTSPMIALILIV